MSGLAAGGGRDAAFTMEAVIGRLLVGGTWIAMALVLVGVGLMLAAGIDPLDHGAVPPFTLGEVVPDMLALRPEGFLWAGIVLIVCLPVGRVVVAGLGFLAAGDRRLALVSLAVLVVVLVSILAAQGMGA